MKSLIIVLTIAIAWLGIYTYRDHMAHKVAQYYEITDDEFEMLIEKRFLDADTNKDWIVSIQEFQEYNQGYLKKYDNDQLAIETVKLRKDIWKNADVDQDNFLTFDEFRNQMYAYRQPQRVE